MSKPTSYDLLIVIHEEIKDLRTEMCARADSNSDRISVLENFNSNLVGKIGMAVLFIGGLISIVTGLITNWINKNI